MSNPACFDLVVLALLLYGLTVGCSGTHHRAARYAERYEYQDNRVYLVEEYLCACPRRIAVYGERYLSRTR